MADHPVKMSTDVMDQLWERAKSAGGDSLAFVGFANACAQWGADQELEACCEWMRGSQTPFMPNQAVDFLYAARRPKSRTLAEQTTAELDDAVMRGDCITTTDAMPLLRAALNRLAELEAQQ